MILITLYESFLRTILFSTNRYAFVVHNIYEIIIKDLLKQIKGESNSSTT